MKNLVKAMHQYVHKEKVLRAYVKHSRDGLTGKFNNLRVKDLTHDQLKYFTSEYIQKLD